MCGIAGIIGWVGTDEKISYLSKKVRNSLHHRGPDANGIFIENNIGLVHTRLSIIDLSKKADQPMTSRDKRYVLIYNCEIYNFKKLRSELLKKKN